ncbi:shikimate kinase [Nonomuraea spiralis]|uniref:shikimate kinase n=1 Tax=Nonomuraea TaxID=83681 RepID=UPI000F7A05D6|nr:shikimate kinase [Nonomuraea sp. WAC 01424]
MRRPPWMILIGPAAAGKTTLGDGLATATGRAFVDIDALGESYYAEVGWTMDRLRARIREVGRVAAEREWEPARAHAVERVVADHPDAIVSFGAGHSHYTRSDLFDRVRAALRPVDHVVLVLPSPDEERSVEVLRRRSLAAKGTDWISADGHDFLAEWVRAPGNHTLATIVLHTGEEDPEQTIRRLSVRCEGVSGRR